jgi:hypothetical protein
MVIKSEQNFSWNQYGINLYVPQDALPEEMQQCTIHIEVNTMEKCQLPKNAYFASPVYLIKCIPPVYQFSKPLTLEIQHCSRQNSFDKLCFVRSTSAKLGFDIIDSGDDHVYHTSFPQHCSYGLIKLDRFCGYAAAQTQTERGSSCERLYRANIFYEKKDTKLYKVHFVILQNTNAPNKVRWH